MNRRFTIACAAVVIAGLWIPVLIPQRLRDLSVTFLDVGQGDSMVVQTPGEHTLVVDSGRISRDADDDGGRQVVLPFLRSQGINRIDALLLTHPDDDHVGGART